MSLDALTLRTIVQEVFQLKTFFKIADGLTVQTADCWPNQSTCQPPTDNDPEVKSEAWLGLSSEVHHEFLDPKRTSSWAHLVRDTSWVFRFVTSCCHKIKHVKVTIGPLSLEELMSAKEFWINKAQAYSDDLTWLAAGKEVHCSSDLRSLYPYTDEKGILRVEVD